MTKLLTLVLLSIAATSFAQTYSAPVFPASGKNMQEFVLPNWSLKDSAQGDLNGDKIPDLALVVEWKDTVQELRPDSSTNKGSPRVLLILFKNPQSSLYEVALQHNTFILRYGEGGMDPEAYDKISIKNRVLNIAFQYLRGHADYKFRFQQKDFKLIGATTAGVSGGQLESWDFNFSTKKALHQWGGISDDKLKEEWKAVPLPQLKCLKEMLMPNEWEVLPNVFI